MFQLQDEDYTSIGNNLNLKDEALHELMIAVIEKGASFRFRARGFSMSPFIRDRDVITLAPLKGIGPGDVVAFRHPQSGKLAVHRILETKTEGCLIKGDNVPEPDGIIPDEDILAVAVMVERKCRKVAGGLGHTKWLLASLSKHNMLWIFDPMLPLIPFARLLRRLQEFRTYRRAVRSLNPQIKILDASKIDMEKLSDRMGIIYSLNPKATCFVAQLNSRIVGCASLVRHSPHGSYWIPNLSVWLPCRGLGLGEALCRQIIERARAEGAEELRLLVNPQNRAAINLYKKLGFKPTVIPGLEEQLDDELKAIGRRWMAMSMRPCS